VMHKGRIEQVDAPARFFEAPANAFVARFVGIDTLLRPERVVSSAGQTEATVGGQTLPVRTQGTVDTSASVIAIRPDRLFLAPQGAPHALTLTVVETTFRGLHRDLKLAFSDGQTIVIAIEADTDIKQLSPGQQVAVGLKPDAAVLISSAGLPPGG
jgi:spermidine/putrescine transport system ATP-binding protein